MRLAHTQEARQQQTQRIDPRQILASEILTWTTAELEAAVEQELSENPALEVRDEEMLPTANLVRESFAEPFGNRDERTDDATWQRQTLNTFDPGEDALDPMERLASSLTLHDHLREQVGQVAEGRTASLVRYLIECVDDRGYLTADIAETAERFRVTRQEVEWAVRSLQAMDPPGVGARDLRECLLLQLEYLRQTGEMHPLAWRLVADSWDDLAGHRENRIASRLGVSLEQVRSAQAFLQQSLTPYPGAAFRPAWQKSSGAAAVRPDVVFHRTPAGIAVEVTRDYSDGLQVAPLWKKLADKPDAAGDEAMRRYVREHVERAGGFMNGLRRRSKTLRAIALSLVERQQGFIETGNRAFLRPLTRQTLSEALELDESVVSRAVADKWAQLPGGEVVALDAFFGNAHAVRDALVSLIAGENPQNPYSDDEIADILTEQGFPLARRTVAKYRHLEKILPARLRRRSGTKAA